MLIATFLRFLVLVRNLTCQDRMCYEIKESFCLCYCLNTAAVNSYLHFGNSKFFISFPESVLVL